MFRVLSVAFALGLVVGCGDDDRPAIGDDGGSPADAAAPKTDGGGVDAAVPPSTCGRTAAAPDRVRHVVVAHPFAEGGGTSYEVLELDASGELHATGTTFDMGRGNTGEIVFTPDGRVGAVAQDDGSVGVFRFDYAGAPEVVEASYHGPFYAGAVVADPSGDHFWVLDQEWRDIGGGIYRLDVACDDTVAGAELVAPAKLPYAMVPRGGGAFLVGAKDILDSTAGADVHLVRLDAPEVVASADGFDDDDWIGSSSALTPNGRHFLLGENAAFSSVPNRILVVGVDGDALSAVQTVSPIEDPVAIVTSPFDDAALVSSGFGDALLVLPYDPDAATPFGAPAELDYEGGRPQLPGAAVMVRTGRLEGLVLVAENVAVRRVQFDARGGAHDLGAFGLGSGSAAIAGAIGVTP